MARIKFEDLPRMEEMKDEKSKGNFGGLLLPAVQMGFLGNNRMSQDTNILPEQVEQLRIDLAGKVRATGEYDAIIWKIRTGYVVLLYGAIGLLAGKENVLSLQGIGENTVLSIAVCLMILGFSLSVFLIDLAFVRSKMQVVVARDELMRAFVNPAGLPELKRLGRLLTLSGEDPTLFETHRGSDDEELRKKLLAQFRKRMIWNRWRVFVWLYAIAPATSLVILGIAHLAT